MNTLDHLFGSQSPEEQVETNTFILMSRFLQLIEQVMEDQGMTRREMAERIGTSPSYVTQLFRGHKMVNLETLAKIEIALGIEFDVKIYGSEAKQEDYDDQRHSPKTTMDGQGGRFFSTHYPKLGDQVLNQSA